MGKYEIMSWNQTEGIDNFAFNENFKKRREKLFLSLNWWGVEGMQEQKMSRLLYFLSFVEN